MSLIIVFLSYNKGDTRSKNMYRKLAPNRTQLCSVQVFLWQKLSNTADLSNQTVLVTCIGASFWNETKRNEVNDWIGGKI